MDEISTYLKDIEGFPDFRDDPDGVAVLVKKMRAGDKKAELSLIESTLKYIAEVVNCHCHMWGAWQNRLDLLQEANTEISKKIAVYDPAKGSLKGFISFRSYVAFVRFWSKARVVNATEHGRKIINALQRALGDLSLELGREPTLEELSERLGMDESKVYALQNQPGVTVFGIGEDSEEENGMEVVSLESLTSPEFDPFRFIEAAELRETLIECLGEIDADLLLAYFESGSVGFRRLHLPLCRKNLSADGARKAKQRLFDRLKICPRAKDRLFPAGEMP
jgi:DNA-directed RNA polymerase specialized sigma subunit